MTANLEDRDGQQARDDTRCEPLAKPPLSPSPQSATRRAVYIIGPGLPKPTRAEVAGPGATRQKTPARADRRRRPL